MWLAGATFGLGGTVVFLVGLNKQFSPQLNGRNGLGMCLQYFLVLPGSVPDCITGLVARRNCYVYHGGRLPLMAYLLHVFLLNNAHQYTVSCAEFKDMGQ